MPFITREFSLACSVVTLCAVFYIGPASVRAEEQRCFPTNPETIVFDVVEENKESTSLGVAFLADAKRGLFLTAYHNYSPNKLLLRKNTGGHALRVKKIISGSSTPALSDDWVLLEAETSNAPVSALPFVAGQLNYDTPSAVSLAELLILGSGGTVRTVRSVDWRTKVDVGGNCDIEDIALFEVPSYDKGYSGAPVYSPSMCNVVGITSRFALPSDATSPQRAQLIKYFWKHYDTLTRKPTPQVGADDMASAIQEILKDKVYVKMVPTKCIIDRLINESWDDEKGDGDASRLLRKQLLPNAGQIITLIDEIPTLSARGRLGELTDLIMRETWDWLEFLQLYDRFERKQLLGNWEGKTRKIALISSAIQTVAKQKRFQTVADVFYESFDRNRKKYAQHDKLPKEEALNKLDYAEMGQQFQEKNRDWAYSKRASDFGLKFPQFPIAGEDPKSFIEDGKELSALLDQAESSKWTPETRQLIRNTSIGLTSTGVSLAIERREDETVGFGLSRLAATLVGDGGNIPYRQLGIQLASASKDLISDKKSDEYMLASRIAEPMDFASNRVVVRLTASQFLNKQVVNDRDENLGEVKDVILDQNGGWYAVIGVGGFLGIGEKKVGVPIHNFALAPNDKVLLNYSKETLSAAPNFVYEKF